MIEQHFTTARVAELLGCSPDTILRLAQRGDIHSVFVGRERRYPESAVEEYLNRNASRGPHGFAPVVPLRQDRGPTTRRTA